MTVTQDPVGFVGAQISFTANGTLKARSAMKYGRVRFEYESDSLEHLNLKKGEILELQSVPTHGLWKGKKINSAETGFFPHNYVEVLSSSEQSALLSKQPEETVTDPDEVEDAKPETVEEDDEEEAETHSQRKETGRFVKVLYDFASAEFNGKGNINCIDVTEGEYVKIVEGDKGNGWILIHKMNGTSATGSIPASYVSLLPMKARVLFSFDPGLCLLYGHYSSSSSSSSDDWSSNREGRLCSRTQQVHENRRRRNNHSE